MTHHRSSSPVVGGGRRRLSININWSFILSRLSVGGKPGSVAVVAASREWRWGDKK